MRATGAAVQLITDGDVAGVIATSDPATGIDIYMGQGGAPEGVLAAAALRCVGGQMQTRLIFKKDDERARAAKLGITDFNRKYSLMDLASGDVVFAATGVTDGSMLRACMSTANSFTTESVVMRSATGTVRWIKARHSRTRHVRLTRALDTRLKRHSASRAPSPAADGVCARRMKRLFARWRAITAFRPAGARARGARRRRPVTFADLLNPTLKRLLPEPLLLAGHGTRRCARECRD